MTARKRSREDPVRTAEEKARRRSDEARRRNAAEAARREDGAAVEVARLALSPGQWSSVVSILRGMADDGCDFASSRLWRSESCAQDSGRSFDCDRCTARRLLRELKLRTIEDMRSGRTEGKQE